MNMFKTMFAKIDLYLKHKLQNKANKKFLNVAIPMKIPCCVLTGRDFIICNIAGYVLDKEIGVITMIIVGINRAEYKKSIQVEDSFGEVADWTLNQSTIWRNLWGSDRYGIMDEKMVFLDDLPKYDGYLIVTADRLFNNTLIKMERKKIKLRVPNRDE